jgi:allophanate hydrolase subunit 1
MSKGKYDVILDTMPATESRLEILFRQAGDGFLQVEYGREQRAALQDSFRMLAINDIILGKQIKGLIETVPGIRTNLLHFDPEIVSYAEIIDIVKTSEDSMPTIDDVVLESRVIHLPIAFEDSETKRPWRNMLPKFVLTHPTISMVTTLSTWPCVTASVWMRPKS